MTYLAAVVEDDPAERSTLSGYLRRYAETQQLDIEIRTFDRAELLLAGYQPVYDLIFLDISLPGINGMDAAARIRELDHTVTLIFITNLAQYAVNGYEVNAFDFMLKPVAYPTFALKLQRAFHHLVHNPNSELLITMGSSITRIHVRSIRYIEISKHDILIHTDSGTVKTYGNLKQIEEQLDPARFVRCNSCYLVNLNFAERIDGMTVYVEGTPLQMSRPRRKGFIEALNNFLGGCCG